MPAIITDQLRVLSASNFLAGVSTNTNSYYSFIGLPNATDVASDWNTNTPSPIDNFDNYNDIYDTLISAKKINDTDVVRVIKKRFKGRLLFLINKRLFLRLNKQEMSHLC